MDIDKAIQLALKEHKAGNLQQAELIYRKILKKQPNDIDALHLLGVLLHHQGHYDSAIKYIRKAIKLDGGFAEAYNNLGNVTRDKGLIDEAETYYQKALQINPNFAIAYNNLGNIYSEKKVPDKALLSFQRALQINPNFAEAYNNLGRVFSEKNKHDEAISCFQRALQINPNYAEAYNNLGTIYAEKKLLDKAMLSFQKALQIDPNLADAYIQLSYLMQQMCYWQELGSMTAKCDALTRTALDIGAKPAETPFMSISRRTDPNINFAIAQSWSRDIARTMARFEIPFSFDVRRSGKPKIVVGYLSNNFRNHAMAHLMLSLFGLHNRNEFKICCLSYGKDDGSYYRSRIQHDCDHFIDISGLSDDSAARCIYENQVDIIVDLNGYTTGSRSAICALRPAPIQIRYLGFPGTMGADFFDYIIADKIVIPKDHEHYYSEKFVYMPHCYQVNDYAQPISEKNWGKEHFGLPENCFIFCSFNQPYKIDPVIFDSWMRILKQVPGGVLWLVFWNKIVEDNLRREAEKRDIQTERLIFAESLPKNEHLARLKLADLALDTRIVNGHITTSDALWAGVPVITLQGSHFASRACSSILSGLGISELITYSLEAYESLAIRLAHNPIELKEIRHRIAEDRLKMPLFDTPRFVRNLETAYKEMWKIFLSVEAPRQIEVLEG